MTPVKLSCPKCKRTVPEVLWKDVDVVRCSSCESHFEQVRFPALTATRQVDRPSDLAAGEANCFFHHQNRAEIACDSCGRYLCSVCHVPFAGKHFCPSCLETRSDRKKLPENHRLLYGQIALVTAVLPLLFWPITLLTAPTVLVLCFYGWKKPASLVPHRSKLRFVIAGLIAVAQIVGWLFLFGNLLLR